jgi:hypothetical protein
MKYLFVADSDVGVRWDRPFLDCESDFDERRPTEAEMEILRNAARMEDQYEEGLEQRLFDQQDTVICI